MFNNKLPIVVIVGRPNVGKSSLFNRLLKRRVAVTNREEGTTRDRQSHELEWNRKKFILEDTGGLVPSKKEREADFIRKQVKLASEESDLILFVVDAQAGLTDLDTAILRELREKRGKIILVANKADNEALQAGLYEFLPLGLGEPFAVSSLHGAGAADLLDLVAEKLPGQAEETAGNAIPSIAIVGRPNSGKSSLVNALLGEERTLTDSRPGTTRDSVHSLLVHQGRNVLLIDTAGLRKTSRVRNDVEFYASLRTDQADERCDVAVVLVDMETGLEEQDLHIMRKAVRRGKGLVVALNKWDLAQKSSRTFDDIVKAMTFKAPFLAHYPVLSISAATGLRAGKVLDTALLVHDRLDASFSKEELEAFLREAEAAHQHPAVDGHAVRFFGIRQARTRPLIVEITASLPYNIRENYVRYLEKRFYGHFECLGRPLRFRFVRRRKRTQAPLRPLRKKVLS